MQIRFVVHFAWWEVQYCCMGNSCLLDLGNTNYVGGDVGGDGVPFVYIRIHIG